MGKLYKLKRKGDQEVTAEVLHEGRVINGKYVPPGNIRIVAGMSDEEYPITWETGRKGYEIPPEMEEELRKANNK